MKEYIELQIREILRFGRLIHKEGNEAVIEWTNRGLAKRFAQKHRSEFGLIEETI